MNPEDPSHGPPDNPLAGVLDRLLSRERGAPRPAPPTAADTRAVPRRMLTIAGLGREAGDGALRAAARWALRGGRRPAVLDLACGEPAAHDGSPPPGETARIPMACVPCGPERLREEPPEVVASLLDRLRRHELASDLLLVRVPSRCRAALARAAFVGGGLIVPVEDSDAVINEAFRLSREIRESFLDLAVWPLGTDGRGLARYTAMVRTFLRVDLAPFDPASSEPGAVLDRLNAAPDEGFATALLAWDAPAPPAELLRIGSLAV